MSSPRPGPAAFALPTPYRLFFLILEPISTLVGAYFAHFKQSTYLHLTDPHDKLFSTSSVNLGIFPDVHPANPALPRVSSIALTQLANLYLLFAFIETLVLRSTADLKVWRAVLFSFLVADFGHLWSVHSLGWDKYYRLDQWNSMDFGNIGVVYVGALLRICFLLGVGFGKKPRSIKQKQ